MQIGIACLRQLIRMGSQNQVESRVLKCRSRKTVGSYEDSSIPCLIGQCTPANIFVIAHILRFREVYELTCYAIRILFDKLSALTVGIVIYRSASIVSEVTVLLWNFHHITQTWQNQTRTIGSNAGLQFDRTVRIHCPYLVSDKFKVIATEFSVGQFFDAILTGACTTLNACGIRCLRFYRKTQYQSAIAFIQYFIFSCFMNQIVQTMFEPGGIEPVIIVCKSTESIELRTVAIGDNSLVAILQTVDTSGLRVKYGFKVSSLYKDALRILVQYESIQFCCTGSYFTDGRAIRSLLYQNLFLCHRKAFGSPRSLIFQYKL